MRKPRGKSRRHSTAALEAAKRARVSQSDVPAYPLKTALKVPRAILDNYGNHPATPLQVAQALEQQPTSGGFRMLTGAAIAYGLTSGGYNADTITVEPLARRILKPTQEGDDLAATREAVLRPRVVREFLQRYDGASLPRSDIARNVLSDMGVPGERIDAVYALIRESAQEVGFIRSIKDREYVDLGSATGTSSPPEGDDSDGVGPEDVPAPAAPVVTLPVLSTSERDPRLRRVFITHGKNRDFIPALRKLLSFGELEAVVSVERETVAQPIPDKVRGDMRSCGAAIIHVDDEQRLIDASAAEHIVLNPNVLIEVGAAMALYDRRFILLAKEGLTLPSNLQGLSVVRYKGDALDGEATIKLLEAINDIKNHPLPPAR